MYAFALNAHYVLKKFDDHYSKQSPRMFVIESTATIAPGAFDSIPREIRETAFLRGSNLTLISAPEHLSGKQSLVKNNDRFITTLNDVIIGREKFYEPIINSLITKNGPKDTLLFLNGLGVKIQSKSFPVHEETPIPDDFKPYTAIGERRNVGSERIQIWFDTSFLPIKMVLENKEGKKFIEYYKNYSVFKTYPHEIEVYTGNERLLTYTVSSFRPEVIEEATFDLTPFSLLLSQKIILSTIDKKDPVALYTHQLKARYSLKK